MTADLPPRALAALLPFVLMEFSAAVLLGGGGAELALLASPAMPCRKNDAMAGAGVGGGVEDAILAELTAEPAPVDAELPALELAAPVPAANPLTPASAAPAATAPARTTANAVDPTSPEMILLAVNGTNAMDSA